MRKGLRIAILPAILLVGLAVFVGLPAAQSGVSTLTDTLYVGMVDRVYGAEPDFTCDGADDQIQINQAITALPDEGGTVVLLAGNYDIAGTITPVDNLTLEGQGRATTLIAADNLDDEIMYASGISHLRLANFAVDGNKANQTGAPDPDEGTNLRFTNLTYSTIENLFVYDCNLRGLDFWTGCDFNTVINSDFYNNNTEGVIVNDGDSNTFIGNIFRDNENDGINLYFNSANNVVGGNIAVGNGTGGFTCEKELGGGNPSQRNIFTGNYSAGNREGFVLDESHWNVIEGNYSYSNTEEGIDLLASDANIIKDNCVRDNTEEGINLNATSDNNVVTDNYLTGNTPDLADAGSGNVVKENYGWVTENAGTATLLNGNTSIVVTHSLDVTPAAGDIVVTPMENWGSMTEFYIDTYTATQFTIHADQDPGEDVDFAWSADVY